MLSRRTFLVGAASFAVLPALAHPFKLEPEYEPQIVPFQGYDPGSIVVHPRTRFLFRVESVGTATRYGIGVGRAGLEFTGSAVVGDKAEWPSWRPTEQMIRRSPEKYARFAEGLPGGPGNPLGARALYLYRNGRDTMYRIHGTNEPQSIGKAVSNGCIRMLNEHVVELYERTPIGTFVFVV